MRIYLASILVFLHILLPANALSPEERLKDEKLENRASELFLQVRCLVCNGQVIENSDTAFSFEMRKLIRQKIKEGESDEEIKNYLTAEYGEDILNVANFSSEKIFLFILPIFFLLGGVFFIFRFIKK